MNGTARLAGRRDRRQPHGRQSCRASRNAARRAAHSRSAALSSMIPCDTETLRSASISAGVMTPG